MSEISLGLGFSKSEGGWARESLPPPYMAGDRERAGSASGQSATASGNPSSPERRGKRKVSFGLDWTRRLCDLAWSHTVTHTHFGVARLSSSHVQEREMIDVSQLCERN